MIFVGRNHLQTRDISILKHNMHDFLWGGGGATCPTAPRIATPLAQTSSPRNITPVGISSHSVSVINSFVVTSSSALTAKHYASSAARQKGLSSCVHQKHAFRDNRICSV